jgi:hypothetical protein
LRYIPPIFQRVKNHCFKKAFQEERLFCSLIERDL